MTFRMFGLSAAVAVAITSAAPAAQAPARSIGTVLDTLDRVRAFHETAMSPDGRRVAWVEDVSVADETTAIYLRQFSTVDPGAAETPRGSTGSPRPEPAEARRVTAATDGRAHMENGVAWAPDNHTIAFLSDAGSPSQRQVYVLDVDGSGPAAGFGELTP